MMNINNINAINTNPTAPAVAHRFLFEGETATLRYEENPATFIFEVVAEGGALADELNEMSQEALLAIFNRASNAAAAAL